MNFSELQLIRHEINTLLSSMAQLPPLTEATAMYDEHIDLVFRHVIRLHTCARLVLALEPATARLPSRRPRAGASEAVLEEPPNGAPRVHCILHT